jgi:ribosome-binding protein aMBF1 (putative translation factor)
MADQPVCWRCGATLQDVPLPLGRRAECPACHAELHVCRMCRHYDTRKAKHCRETAAEEIREKTRANFCDWFQPCHEAYAPDSPRAEDRSRLDALFGDTGVDKRPDDPRRALDDLFG